MIHDVIIFRKITIIYSYTNNDDNTIHNFIYIEYNDIDVKSISISNKIFPNESWEDGG